MEPAAEEEIILMLNLIQQNLMRVLQNGRRRTIRRIMRARQNLLRAQRASVEFITNYMLFAVGEAVSNVVPRIRTVGQKERSTEWWFRDVLQTYDDDQWKEDFRMNRKTFFDLVDILRDQLAPSPDTFVEPLSVEIKVAVAIYKYASCSEYRAVGKGFGVSKSTVCLCVHTVAEAIINTMSRKYLSWPSPEECEEIAREFERKTGLPQALGAIDGTHIPVTAPREGAADFTNRKCYASIVVQAVVDHKMLFRDITAKHPGCNHDATVLRDSYLFNNHDRMFPESNRVLDGVADGNGTPLLFPVPYYIVGDPAYPLQTWLLKNYPMEESPEEESFNLRMNKLRIIVEQAFGRLKGRWRLLCKKSDLFVFNMPKVISACAILHNFVEINDQGYNPLWDQDRLEGEREFPQPDPVLPQGHRHGEDAALLRDHIRAYLARHFPLLTREHL